jgi:hypothetical protein
MKVNVQAIAERLWRGSLKMAEARAGGERGWIRALLASITMLCLAGAPVLLVFSGQAAFSAHTDLKRLRAEGVERTAVVTVVQEVTRGRSASRFKLDYEFTTTRGERHTGSALVSKPATTPYTVGWRMRVIHVPTAPWINTPSLDHVVAERNDAIFAAGLFALIFAVLAVFAWSYGRLPKGIVLALPISAPHSPAPSTPAR